MSHECNETAVFPRQNVVSFLSRLLPTATATEHGSCLIPQTSVRAWAAHVQQENKLRYCARATNVRFFTRNTLSRFLTLKHMLATGVQLELENPGLGKSWITSMQAMLCSRGSVLGSYAYVTKSIL